ncbi:MAG: O-antigen ligase family protein, partial [Bacilli bacterium]|nr:O-antigen ligase family protein [Bacilli bacterium]
LLMLVDLFKEKKINFDLNKLIIIYLTYIILVFIPNITNTGYLSYYHSKVGTVGWFLSANAIGNILCILTPFMILFLLKSKINIIFKLLITLATCYVFVSMGTKVPVLGLGISVMVNTIYFMIKWIKEKKYKLFISLASAGVVAIIAAIIVIPKTSFYENIQIHKKFLGFDHYSEIFTDYKLVDHFIFSQRLTFLKNTHNNYLKTNIYEKTFGMGFIENYATDNVSDKTIEIDYFEVFYRNGIIGCILYFIILIPFIVKYFKTKYEGIESVEFKLSMVLILLLALFSGHVLVTPAVSIYVALIIAIYINKDSYKYFIKEKKETSK